MFQKKTLDNGVRIVYEHIPHVRSVSMGIWVGTGSRYEKAFQSGASHFIEHMVFKGTEKRTAAQIAALSDRIGGQINAYTTKESTCFYGRVLDTHLPMLTDILCDMLFNSKFDEEDVKNERGVILEEISMYEDTPEDLVMERLMASIYKGSSLGRPILGKKSTLDKMDGEFLKEYMRSHYSPDRIVIALSGSFRPEDIDDIAARFSVLSGKAGTYKKAEYIPSFTTKRKNIEQNHLVIAFPGISIPDNDRFAMQIMSNILGGGMSSRLFQSVREDHGLCYSVYTLSSSHLDGGIFGIYTALGENTQEEALRLIVQEIEKIKTDGVTEDELTLIKDQAESNILMSLESTSSRMNRLGRNELFLGEIPSPDELIAGYEAVTMDDIRAICEKIFDFSKVSFSAVGKTLHADEYRKIIGV